MLRKLLTGMILLMVIAACQAPAEDNAEILPGQGENNMAEDEPEETETSPESAAEPAMDEKVVDDKVQQLLDRSERTTSMRFVFVGPPENLPRDTYYVKGERIAVELHKAADFKVSQPFTHVYMDTEAEQAIAYCNVKDVIRCPDGVQTHGAVEFDNYYVMTPLDWLEAIDTAVARGTGPQYEKKSTTAVEFKADGKSGVMLIIDFLGLPGKITFDDGTTIEFRDLSVNSASDEQVAPPGEWDSGPERQG